MPLSVLALVLASAIIHATWNLWLKQLGPSVRSGPLMWVLTALSSLLFAPVALWMIAHGSWRPTPIAIGFILASGAIHVVYFLLLLRGYRVGDLSLVYPVARGTGPMLAFIGAVVLMGERASLMSVSGALLIVLGVVVLTWQRDGVAQARLGPGLRYGLAIGVSIAVYLLWDGWAVKRLLVPPLVYYWGGEVTRVLLFTPAALADRAGVTALWREHRWRMIGIAVLSPFSYILILLALRSGPISHIAPAREISILLGAYLGGRVLGEGQRRRRLVAAGAFAAGVIALALAR